MTKHELVVPLSLDDCYERLRYKYREPPGRKIRLKRANKRIVTFQMYWVGGVLEEQGDGVTLVQLSLRWGELSKKHRQARIRDLWGTFTEPVRKFIVPQSRDDFAKRLRHQYKVDKPRTGFFQPGYTLWLSQLNSETSTYRIVYGTTQQWEWSAQGMLKDQGHGVTLVRVWVIRPKHMLTPAETSLALTTMLYSAALCLGVFMFPTDVLLGAVLLGILMWLWLGIRFWWISRNDGETYDLGWFSHHATRDLYTFFEETTRQDKSARRSKT